MYVAFFPTYIYTTKDTDWNIKQNIPLDALIKLYLYTPFVFLVLISIDSSCKCNYRLVIIPCILATCINITFIP